MKKRIVHLIVMLLIISLLAGCGASAPQKEQTKANETNNGGGSTAAAETFFGIEPLPEPTKVRIAFFAGAHHANAFKVAEAKGWLEELNIIPEYVTFVNGPAMMEAMNDWDFGTTGAPGAINGMVGRGLKVLGLASEDSMLDLYVREDHPIYKAGKGHIPGYPDIYGKPEDWKGTTWLLPMGTTMHFTLVSVLEAMGLSADDVTIINMDVSSALNAFKAGQGDGLGVWVAVSMAASRSGFKRVASIGNAGKYMTTNFFANPDFLKNNREIVKKLVEIYVATAYWGYQPQNREEAAQIFLQHCEDEGIKITFEDCLYTYEMCSQFSLEEQIAMAQKIVEDPKGMKKDMNEIEYLIIDTFDFFHSLGNYDDDQRERVLDGLIDTSILLEIGEDYKAAGKPLP
jgi:ABC-type nitrate/sulfonate/bicarbonate transport system substrate-binding protein